jgi:hypothetical protein
MTLTTQAHTFAGPVAVTAAIRCPGAVDRTETGGRNEIGRPRRMDGGGWERVDVYTGHDGEVFRERRFAAGADDFSPMFCEEYAAAGHKGNGHYKAQCGCCWFGFSHTLALHDQAPEGWNT